MQARTQFFRYHITYYYPIDAVVKFQVLHPVSYYPSPHTHSHADSSRWQLWMSYTTAWFSVSQHPIFAAYDWYLWFKNQIPQPQEKEFSAQHSCLPAGSNAHNQGGHSAQYDVKLETLRAGSKILRALTLYNIIQLSYNYLISFSLRNPSAKTLKTLSSKYLISGCSTPKKPHQITPDAVNHEAC